ncbi:MAG: hypothetical protein NTW12_09080 [Deltaproteobacteria bacterium]|nr:hypothetical protein [Deltaproteobacteria bacterium]
MNVLTHNEINRYLNAEKRGLFAMVENLWASTPSPAVNWSGSVPKPCGNSMASSKPSVIMEKK